MDANSTFGPVNIQNLEQLGIAPELVLGDELANLNVVLSCACVFPKPRSYRPRDIVSGSDILVRCFLSYLFQRYVLLPGLLTDGFERQVSVSHNGLGLRRVGNDSGAGVGATAARELAT